MHPIVIAGFGRSGTTWVSDIVSKALGSLILFEPDHPCVFSESQKNIYCPQLDKVSIQNHLDRILNKKNRNSWLLRNHLLSNQSTSDELINIIWESCNVIGFKSIRWNHDLITLGSISDNKMIYIIRHPLAVVASLLRRDRFFLDLGWDVHWTLFKKRNPLKGVDLAKYDTAELSIKYAAMWSVSNIKALMDLKTLGLPHWSYENLYNDPFGTAHNMMAYIGFENVNIHPSYLFYPSMSTLKTYHVDGENWPVIKDGDHSFFWKETLEKDASARVISTIKEVSSLYPEIMDSFQHLDYLRT